MLLDLRSLKKKIFYSDLIDLTLAIPVDDILGMEVVHPLRGLPRNLDHVKQLKLGLVHVQMLQKKG